MRGDGKRVRKGFIWVFTLRYNFLKNATQSGQKKSKQ